MASDAQDTKKDLKKMAESLSEGEVLVLKSLVEKKKASSAELEKAAKLSQVEVVRALQWLDNKRLIKLKREEKEVAILGEYGQKYQKEGLPERKLLAFILKNKAVNFSDAQKRSGLSGEEFSAALGALKKKILVSIEAGKILLKAKPEEALKKTLEEKFLESLPVETSKLSPEEKYALQELAKRKGIIELKRNAVFSAEATEQAKKVLAMMKESPRGKMIENVTPDLLRGEEWKKVKFKRYDVSVRVPEIYGGKRQAYYVFLEQVARELVRLGFKEMQGPTIESEFWNFDALFQPQFHVARDWTATYFAKGLEAELPAKEIVEQVKRQHEKSWQYSWQQEKAKHAILRPQGTCMSARMLPHAEVPGKYFAIARCYRPDVVDTKHLAEFNQVEGIILDENITFQHLLATLKKFAEVFTGAKEVRFIPDYYPFTEPSVQLNVKHPKLGWIEIGGAGIFREEVTKPLGVKVPVIAWGLGVDRLAMFKLGVSDIRQLFSQDLEWLRKQGV